MNERQLISVGGGEPVEDIKIFVSHRIDMDSELVDNPIYFPVRCGAVYDDVRLMDIAGDDTGENISEKRMSYCEFTVQYWAWKNIQADYYGMCHYRRYLSFSDRMYKTDKNGLLCEYILADRAKRKYRLTNEAYMRSEIAKYDIVTSFAADVRRMDTPVGKVNTVQELWEAQHGKQIDRSIIGVLYDLIDEIAPEYSSSAREYFGGTEHRGFNCFVMKKELFDRMCSFQFPILERIAQVDMTDYNDDMKRAPGYVGEMLYGIFVYHAQKYLAASVNHRQLVFFEETHKVTSNMKVALKYAKRRVGTILRAIIQPILPMGSARREKVKDIYYGIIGEQHRKK